MPNHIPPNEFVDLEYIRLVKEQTVCKHKSGSCEKCGTSDRRDSFHDTVGGRGKVGQLIARSKKKK